MLDPRKLRRVCEIIAADGVLACSRQMYDRLQESARLNGLSLDHVQFRIDPHLKKGAMIAIGADLTGLVESQPALALTTSGGAVNGGAPGSRK